MPRSVAWRWWPSGFEAIPGQDLAATIDGRPVLVGNRKLMQTRHGPGRAGRARGKPRGRRRTVIYVAGTAVKRASSPSPMPSDRPRATVEELRQLGIQVAMLTGDNRATAHRIAEELGIETVFAEVLPGQKADKVKELQDQGKRVGDGRRRH